MSCTTLNTRVSKSIGIIITNKCNARCDFCCNNSGPEQQSGLTLEEVLSIVRQAEKLGFNQICFTGGEPILRLPDILLAGNLLHSLGMSMTINSNGFFGKNKIKSAKILNSLCKTGLVKFTLSFDDSHAKYVSPSAVKNIITACRDLGITTHLTSSFYATGNRIDHYFSEEDLRGVVVSENPVQSAGRAHNHDSLCPSDTLPQDLCPSPLGMVVNFDGKIYPCCSVSGFTKSIELGNIRQIALEDAVMRALQSKYLFYIQKRGLSEFFQISPTLEPMTKHAHSVCDLCQIACGSDYIHRKALKFIDDEFLKFGRITLEKIFDVSA